MVYDQSRFHSHHASAANCSRSLGPLAFYRSAMWGLGNRMWRGRLFSLPPCGGGSGWGVGRIGSESAFGHDPHPRPLPTRGRGAGEAGVKFVLGLFMVAVLTTHAAAQAGAPKIAAPAAGFPAPTTKPPALLPIEAAVLKAADELFKQVSGERQPIEIVIDPLIDGITGMETAATRSIGHRISEIIAASYPHIKVLPFSRENIGRATFVFIGTFNPINNAGQPAGARDAFWICFALVDAKEKVVAARAAGRADPVGIDSTPSPLFASSPVWALDNATLAYIRTCQRSRPGDPVAPEYVDRLEVKATLIEAHAAFDSGRLSDALTEFRRVAASPGGGEVIDALNGLYLTLMKAGRTQEAMEVFGRLIDAGFRQQRLGVIFLFEARSAEFSHDPAVANVYPAWLERIGDRTRAAGVCLNIIGHASRTGPERLNVRLTRARAATVRHRLLKTAPQLASRVTTGGAGSREVLVGLPVDDAQTALDRRVEFRSNACGKRIKAKRPTVAAVGPLAVAVHVATLSDQ